MPRVKGGPKTRARRKKRLKLAEGYWGAKSKLYRTATEAIDRALKYAYRDRKVRKLLQGAEAASRDDAKIEWDESVYDGSDWSGRAEGQPFFAQFQTPGGRGGWFGCRATR